VEIPVKKLTPGLLVEIIVLVPDALDAEQESLLFTSQTSLTFWDNPVDDEVWSMNPLVHSH
jgi:hypothetical protein